jgi:hypothetical protein
MNIDKIMKIEVNH